MNDAIYQKVNELWLAFSKQEMLCARFVERFSIGGHRLPPRRQKERGKDSVVERFTWSGSQNCWMHISWEVVPSRVVTVESVVRSVYQHWLEHKSVGLMEHEIIRRFAVGKVGARNDDTRLILKWIKQAEQGGIGAIDTKMLGPAGFHESAVRSNTGVGTAEPQDNKNRAPPAKMTAESTAAEAKVESPKATRSRKAVDLQVMISPKKISILQAIPTPMENASTQAIQQRRTDISAPVIQTPKTSATPEVMYVTTRNIEPSVFLPTRKPITSPVTPTARHSVSKQTAAVQRRFPPPPPPTLDTTSQFSKSSLAIPNPTPSTPTPTKSFSTVKLPFDANFRGRSRSPRAPRDSSSTPHSQYRQRDDDARLSSMTSSSQTRADTYRLSNSDYSPKPRSRNDITRVRSTSERQAATKTIRNIDTSPNPLSYPKPRKENPQPSRDTHDTPAPPMPALYGQPLIPSKKLHSESVAYPPPQYRSPTKIRYAPALYAPNIPTGSQNPHVSPINVPTGPRNPDSWGFRPAYPLSIRLPQSAFPSAKRSRSVHHDQRSLMISGEGNANDERLGKRNTINDGRKNEKSAEKRAREVTEDNLDLKDQKSSPVPLPKRDYVYTEGRDDIEQYKDTGDYY